MSIIWNHDEGRGVICRFAYVPGFAVPQLIGFYSR